MLGAPEVAAFVGLAMGRVGDWIGGGEGENNREMLVDIQFVKVKAY